MEYVLNHLMAMQRIKDAAEKAKKDLSGVTSAQISLPFIAQNDGTPVRIVVFLGINTVITFPKVSRPNDNGVTSSKTISSTSPVKTPL